MCSGGMHQISGRDGLSLFFTRCARSRAISRALADAVVAIVHPDNHEVLPLVLEFVRNSDHKGGKHRTQDCEVNASYRMPKRLRADYPRMAAIIVADSLCSKQPFVEKLSAGRFSFLLVAKPGDHTSLYKDVDGLRRGNLLNRHHTVHRGERPEYEWVTDLPLNGKPDSPLINFIQFRIVVDSGKVTYRNAWVTALVPTTDNITSNWCAPDAHEPAAPAAPL